MAQLSDKITKIVSLMGLKGALVEVDETDRKVNITADEDEWFTKLVPDFVKDFKYIVNILARKENQGLYFVDVNNYRKERERLIIELAKAAASKAISTKGEVRLPSMNAYERRLVHMELSMRPDVKTESIGEGKERGVIVKPL
ncbi:MAG: R3H domain-containing nucleic acid-binding protein [Janthinobacterium sp.]|jgi:predicted RNA-binding protein Jag